MDQPAAPALSLAEIEETRAMIAPHVVRTPVHDWRGREIEALLRARHAGQSQARIVPAGRHLQGARRHLEDAAAEPEELARGVCAVSAGNHAIAAAYAAAALGTTAKVVMMGSANPGPRRDLPRARRRGGDGADGRTAFEMVEAIARDEGRTFIHPFEGPYTALGTATLGLEWLEQVPDLEAVIIAIGGGGLVAGGASAAIKLLKPDCLVFGVEPTGSDTMTPQLRRRRARSTMPRSRTIADSLAPPFALPYSFGLCRRNVDEIVLVDDDQIRAAMALLFREMKLAVEPAARSGDRRLGRPAQGSAGGEEGGRPRLRLEHRFRHVRTPHAARGEAVLVTKTPFGPAEPVEALLVVTSFRKTGKRYGSSPGSAPTQDER